jgi:hypothetical protein
LALANDELRFGFIEVGAFALSFCGAFFAFAFISLY